MSHKRHERRAGRTNLVFALTFTVLAAGFALSVSLPARPSPSAARISTGLARLRPVQIDNLFMTSAEEGFAIGQLPGSPNQGGTVLHTTDGGRVWTEITPHLPSNTQSNVNLTAGFAGSRSAALVLEGSSGTFTVFSTLDGGRMWMRSLPIHAGYSGGIVDIQFLNRLHGFLEVSDPGNSMLLGAMYATKNGGRTWQRVSYSGATQNATAAASDAAAGKPMLGWLPFAGAFSFRTIEDGWISGGQRGGPFGGSGYVWLFRTTDGGRSWSHESLSMPRGWRKAYTTLSEPQWFGNTGYLTMTCWGPHAVASQTFLYVTHDAGRRWTQIPFIRNAGSQAPFSVDFVTAQSGYAMFGGTLYRTQNGWRTWTPVLHNEHLRFAALQFVNPSEGWLYWPGPTTAHWEYTKNGGRTWAAWNPVVRLR
ncbi:MAG: WD40/YVTN/BNR-like repeat-containing protein [Bacilli bacterium]